MAVPVADDFGDARLLDIALSLTSRTLHPDDPLRQFPACGLRPRECPVRRVSLVPDEPHGRRPDVDRRRDRRRRARCRRWTHDFVRSPVWAVSIMKRGFMLILF